jgi:DNA-binding response OmpR family regulator
MPLGMVLVIEDDAAIRRGLSDALEGAGYAVRSAGDGRGGLEAALAGAFDLVLLDLLLPGLDGLEVLREVRRARPALPVIVLTARGEEEDRVRGLRGGADDYVIKPFGVAELLARIEAVLRRTPARPTGVPALRVEGRTIDFERREVVFDDGRRAPLAQKEAELLAYLASNPGRAVSRDELLQRVWGVDPRGLHTRTIDMAMARLREQIGDDPARPRVVRTVRGRGYMLEGPPEGDGSGVA